MRKAKFLRDPKEKEQEKEKDKLALGLARLTTLHMSSDLLLLIPFSVR